MSQIWKNIIYFIKCSRILKITPDLKISWILKNVLNSKNVHHFYKCPWISKIVCIFQNLYGFQNMFVNFKKCSKFQKLLTFLKIVPVLKKAKMKKKKRKRRKTENEKPRKTWKEKKQRIKENRLQPSQNQKWSLPKNSTRGSTSHTKRICGQAQKRKDVARGYPFGGYPPTYARNRIRHHDHLVATERPETREVESYVSPMLIPIRNHLRAGYYRAGPLP